VRWRAKKAPTPPGVDDAFVVGSVVSSEVSRTRRS
jgi:hypothetical protein